MTQYDPFAAQQFIGNEYVSSHQNVRDVINPSTLQPCGRIADATPAEIGPLVSQATRNKVIHLVDDTVAKGAKLHTVAGFRRIFPRDGSTSPRSCQGSPPKCRSSMKSYLVPSRPCKIENLLEPIALVNRSEFGLGANVFTTEISGAMQAVEEIEAGMVFANNRLIDNDLLPFGGWKNSGIGRSLSRRGLDAFRQSKMAVIEAHPHLHDWWHPYPADVFYPNT